MYLRVFVHAVPETPIPLFPWQTPPQTFGRSSDVLLLQEALPDPQVWIWQPLWVITVWEWVRPPTPTGPRAPGGQAGGCRLPSSGGHRGSAWRGHQPSGQATTEEGPAQGHVPGGPQRTGCRRPRRASPPRQGPGRAWRADVAAAAGGQGRMKPGSPGPESPQAGAGLQARKMAGASAAPTAFTPGGPVRPASRATDTGYPPAMLPSGATSPGRASALQAGALPAFPEQSPCDPRGGPQLRKHRVHGTGR